MGIFNFFKRKKISQNDNIPNNYYGVRTLADKNIYCELVWKENKKLSIDLIGYNKAYDLSVFCGDILRCVNITSNPISNIYCPKIIYSVDWLFILKEELLLKEFMITFSDYMTSTRIYSVSLYAVNNKNKIVKDSFVSTNKVFIDPFELTDNIYKFLKYAENFI